MIDEKLQAQLRAKYNPDGSTLRKGQLRMLEILKSVDGICRKHNIPYWLSSGTLLGAVRHGGFIPWDDDLDIEMLREDYLRLIPILRKELPSNFMLQDDMSEEKYPYLYVKIRDKNSYINEHVDYSIIQKGLFIDIFPLESSYNILYIVSYRLYGLCLRLYFNKHLFNLVKRILLYVIYPVFRLISMFSNQNVLRHTLGMTFLKDRNLKDIFPLKEMKFEDLSFFVPNNYDSYLTKMYGKYMSLPVNRQWHGSIEWIN